MKICDTIEQAQRVPGVIHIEAGAQIVAYQAGDTLPAYLLAPAETAVPEVISPRQFRQALTHAGFRTTVESAVSSADQDTKDWYEFATQFERHHPRVVAMAQALGYTDAQVDAVWTYGAGL